MGTFVLSGKFRGKRSKIDFEPIAVCGTVNTGSIPVEKNISMSMVREY